MIEIEKQPERVRVVDINELYPDVERMPVSSKLRTYLRQVSLKIAPEKILENNSYLARLVTESSLFLPEMFLDRWVKHWEYQVAIALESIWISSTIDFAVNRENEIIVIDWSGIKSDRIAVAQAYLLSQRLGLKPRNIAVVSLIANPLNEDRRINFIRRLFEDNDFYICQQELNQRLIILTRGEDLNPVPEPEPKFDPLLDIESIPEIAID
ncbi:hypothetical protein [Myxosarcina sp. GI1]|uniref:hypothetical protein n=1 Tax=Myxosarcina sp. GI1 TaxID=1541065 RepID=UPI000564B269|nr:hypothetical protein [Myxosarcina sp. GI1]